MKPKTRLRARALSCSRPRAASHRWQVLVAAQRGDGEAALREAQLEPDDGVSPLRISARLLRTRQPSGGDAALADLIAKDSRWVCLSNR